MSLNILRELGVDSTIIEILETKRQNPDSNIEYDRLEKYREAGFTKRVKVIERSDYLRKSPYLIIRASVDIHYIDLGGYARLPHIHLRRRIKHWFFTQEIESVLALIPISQYKDNVPEFILDTIIKNQDNFQDFAIGIPAKPHLINDPILFGAKTTFPIQYNDRGGRNMDLYVLGVWGDDWHELDLGNLK